MTETAYDGTPLQSGLGGADLTGRFPGYSLVGSREAVVVSRRAVDEKGNRSRSAVEYDCRDIQTGDIYPACRRLDHMSGKMNGDDDVLHPATNLRPGAPGPLSRQTPADDTDGDRVLITFVEGSRNKPVIMGVFRHPKATYGAKKSDGERRLMTHNGTTIEILADGTYVITGLGLVSIDGTTIKLGAAAVQPVVRGTDLDTNVLQPISSAAGALTVGMNAALVILNAPPGPPVTCGPAIAAMIAAVNAFNTALQAAIAQFPTTTSTKVKVE